MTSKSVESMMVLDSSRKVLRRGETLFISTVMSWDSRKSLLSRLVIQWSSTIVVAIVVAVSFKDASDDAISHRRHWILFSFNCSSVHYHRFPMTPYRSLSLHDVFPKQAQSFYSHYHHCRCRAAIFPRRYFQPLYSILSYVFS